MPAIALRSSLAAFLLGAAALGAAAHESTLGAIRIAHPYARATPPGQPVGGGYLTLVNGGGDDRLVAAAADVSAATELHSMAMEGGVMRMRQVDAIALPAGGTVELKPGGLHVMFIGLKAPLKAGDEFPLKLRFEKAGETTVTVHVEAPGAGHSAHAP